MKKYITTAIPYVNAQPHVGHAMDYLLADVWARYEQTIGNEVRISAGLDEHGSKIAKRAEEEGKTPQELVDYLEPKFRELIKKLNVVPPSYFVRTTDPEHKRRAQAIWQKLEAAGMIYKGTYEGWYCSGCEAFLAESEAKGVDYKCSDHGKPLEKLSEENYYLKVSKFSTQIKEFVESTVVPKFRGKEILELLKDGAKDVSVSRPIEKLSWGIPVPGDESQVMYVWVDALSNYITALEYPDETWEKDFWPADVEVIGKDILRFHAIIWPAMLLALGLGLPKTLLVHGHITVGGAKMSKSVGNVIDPLAVIDEWGTDAFRYFFLRHVSMWDDGDFSWEKFAAAYNGELANELGNLVARLSNMISKYGAKRKAVSTERHGEVEEVYAATMKSFEFGKALGAAWEIVRGANVYIDETKPWELAKSDKERLGVVLNELWGDMALIARLLAPFLPGTAEKIAKVFSKDKLGELDGVLFPKKDVTI